MKTALLHHLFHHWKLSSVDREQNVDYLKSGIDVGGRTGDDRWGAGGGHHGLKFGKGREQRLENRKKKIAHGPPFREGKGWQPAIPSG